MNSYRDLKPGQQMICRPRKNAVNYEKIKTVKKVTSKADGIRIEFEDGTFWPEMNYELGSMRKQSWIRPL